MGAHPPMFGGMGGAGAGAAADPAPVTPPAATSEAVAADGAPAAKTFGAFTDPDGRIASYSAAITNAVGSTAIASGSGLGAYTVSGYANGDGYVLRLTALDASGNPLATAVHVVDIAAEYDPLVPPSPPAAQALSSGTTSSSAISWGSPTGGSGSTTTADVLTQDVGTGASLSAGAVVGLEDGDVCRVRRTWTDTVTGQTVSATTVVAVAAAGGAYGWETLLDLDLTGADYTARTLTVGAAAVQLMEADGVTPTGISLRYTIRAGTPTASVAHVVGTGITWSVAGTNDAIALGIQFDGQSAEDTDIFAVDVVASISLLNTADASGFGVGPTHLASAAGFVGAYYRSSASTYVWLPIRGTGSAIVGGSNTGSLTGPTADIAFTNVVAGGRSNYSYTAQQSTPLDGVPSGAGVTKHLLGDAQTTAIGSTPNRFGSAIWVTSDLFAGSAAATTGVVKRIRLRRVRVT